MNCQICNKNLGEFQCSMCNKIVCKDHSKLIGGKIYCTEHIPKEPVQAEPILQSKEPPKTLDALKTAIITLAALFAGLLLIYYVVLNSLGELFGLEGFRGLAASFQTTINMFFVGIGAIILFLTLIYFILKMRSK